MLVLFDELQMLRVGLVGIVMPAAGEDEMQRHVKIHVIDIAVQIFLDDARREVDRALMIRQVLVAGGNECLAIFGRVLGQCEEDHVGEMGLSSLDLSGVLDLSVYGEHVSINEADATKVRVKPF